MRRTAAVLIAAVQIAAVAAGALSCGTQAPSSGHLAAAGPAQTKFSLTVLPDTYIAGGKAASFRLDQWTTSGKVVADIRVDGARGLKALFIELDYDAASLTPVAVESVEALGGAANTIELSLLGQPGRLEHGTMLIRPRDGAGQAQGFSGSGVLARVSFERRPFITGRCASTPPSSNASKATLQYDSLTNFLKWSYYNQGDYNQDSRVSVQDLTPIGIYFGDPVPAGSGPDGRDEASIQHVVDGSSDGLINIQDLTAIGSNFGNQVASYHQLLGVPETEYPATNTEASIALSYGDVLFSAAIGNPAAERLRFESSLPPPADTYAWWVRPKDADGNEGTPSETSSGNAAPVWYAQPVDTGSSFGRRSRLFTKPGETGDQPCIAYTRYYTDGVGAFGQVYLAESSDPLGSDMAPTAEVDKFPGGNTSEDVVAFHYNNGTEECIGVGFPSGASQDVYWLEKPDGSAAFAASQTVDTTPTGVRAMGAMLIDGLPAVCFQSTSFATEKGLLRFSRNVGGSFAPALTVVEEEGAAESFRYCAPAMIGGNPALAFYDPVALQLNYIRALTADGGFWPPSAVVAEAGGPGVDTGITPVLLEIEGRPAIFYRENSLTDRVMYKRSEDAGGDDWPGAGVVVAVVTSDVAPYNYAMSAAPRSALAGVAYTRDGNLYYQELTGAAGSFSGEEIISGLAPISGPSLSYVNGRPAVSYYQETLEQLWFAIKY